MFDCSDRILDFAPVADESGVTGVGATAICDSIDGLLSAEAIGGASGVEDGVDDFRGERAGPTDAVDEFDDFGAIAGREEEEELLLPLLLLIPPWFSPCACAA